MNIKILVATHKQCRMPQDDIYLPIFAGKALHPEDDYGYQGDDEGENISTKNPYYSELTAIYWAWKNLKADFIGLVHYRRYFSGKSRKNSWKDVLNSAQAEELCEKYDIILPKRRNLYIETVYSHYDCTFDGKHFDKAREVIEEVCPDYLPFFDQKMKRHSQHLFNMFIMKYEFFDQYCQWLFPILEKLESKYDLENMDPFQARVIGRVSERLLDVWIQKNNFSYKEVDYVLMVKNGFYRKLLKYIKARVLGKKYTESF